jgi:hypothetical protein
MRFSSCDTLLLMRQTLLLMRHASPRSIPPQAPPQRNWLFSIPTDRLTCS